MKNKTVMLALSFFLFAYLQAFANEYRKNGSQKPDITILVIGFGDNVASNYFPKVEIAEKLKVSLEEIDSLLNQKLNNQVQALEIRRISFITKPTNKEIKYLRGHIHFHGEPGQISATINDKYKDFFINLLAEHKADYLLVYNEYFLRWQEVPFNTLFHIFSYTLFDQSLQEVSKGQDHFNTFSLVHSNELTRNLERLVRRNAQSIARNL